MRDQDIRRELNHLVMEPHRHQPDTLVVEELRLCRGECRIDLAVVNGEMNGWEIKSERDTLQRLPKQAEIYSAVFDRVTLVVSPRHQREATLLVPQWWGITVATGDANHPLLIARAARANRRVDANALVQLLWRDELFELLKASSNPALRRAPKRVLWAALVQALQLDELKSAVRRCLKLRTAWRVDRS